MKQRAGELLGLSEEARCEGEKMGLRLSLFLLAISILLEAEMVVMPLEIALGLDSTTMFPMKVPPEAISLGFRYSAIS